MDHIHIRCLESKLDKHLGIANSCCCGIPLRLSFRLIVVGNVMISVAMVMAKFMIVSEEDGSSPPVSEHPFGYPDADDSLLVLYIIGGLQLAVTLFGVFEGRQATTRVGLQGDKINHSAIMFWFVVFGSISSMLQTFVIIGEEDLTFRQMYMLGLWEAFFQAINLYFAYVVHCYSWALRFNLPVERQVAPEPHVNLENAPSMSLGWFDAPEKPLRAPTSIDQEFNGKEWVDSHRKSSARRASQTSAVQDLENQEQVPKRTVVRRMSQSNVSPEEGNGRAPNRRASRRMSSDLPAALQLPTENGVSQVDGSSVIEESSSELLVSPQSSDEGPARATTRRMTRRMSQTSPTGSLPASLQLPTENGINGINS